MVVHLFVERYSVCIKDSLCPTHHTNKILYRKGLICIIILGHALLGNPHIRQVLPDNTQIQKMKGMYCTNTAVDRTMENMKRAILVNLKEFNSVQTRYKNMKSFIYVTCSFRNIKD